MIRGLVGGVGDVLLRPGELEVSYCRLCDAHETKTCKVTSAPCRRRRRVGLEEFEFRPVVGHRMAQDRAANAIPSLSLSV